MYSKRDGQTDEEKQYSGNPEDDLSTERVGQEMGSPAKEVEGGGNRGLGTNGRSFGLHLEQEAVAELRGPIVYALTRPDGTVFYVGQTTNPAERLQVHMARFGDDIKLKILQSRFTTETVSEAEMHWIKYYESTGNLINISGVGKSYGKDDLLSKRGGVRIDPSIMNLLLDEQNRLRKAEGKKPSYSELIRRMWQAYSRKGENWATPLVQAKNDFSEPTHAQLTPHEKMLVTALLTALRDPTLCEPHSLFRKLLGSWIPQ